ncbi:hypothetical protein CKM354_001121100 [Cercospora kikuchii]|uniref:Amidase domain-containing protein n=1 Tax=Cercospora kikuchii TaxID=84275 RepID=A0A9P3FHV9_9PEZI|nr:uncharacterized protein CKM354_001121100 [Cercospora kikuchii]GIZ48138.1 hypothetical protein CKM354_001121100 [Cercospora kikuchii]
MADQSSLTPRVPWTEIVKQKRADQSKRISEYEQIYISEPLQDSQIEAITSIDAVEDLATRIAAKEFTAVAATKAYIQKAIAAHKKTNCLTEVLFAEAVKQARELDSYLQTTGKTKGPLHGVCMTLKDQFDVTGHDTTLGYVGMSFQPAKKDALLVKVLKEAGVVFIAKTNLPQSIMWCETENPLFGLTTHPMNLDLTPGGSTGGEGALLHDHGSILGWGTDIGGSVRIPAHMCGLYSLKPSSGRLPYLGCQVTTAGQEHVPSVVGPLSRSLSSLSTVTRTLLASSPWLHDPTCHRIPWDQSLYSETQNRPLTIGLLLEDGLVRPHPPNTRILTNLSGKLQSSGHTIRPWLPENHTPLHREAISIMDTYYLSDGCLDLRTSLALANEPPISRVSDLLAQALASPSKGAPFTVPEYWALNLRKRAVQAKYLELWNSIRDPRTDRECDVLIMPVMPHSAVRHRECKWVGYTKVWNLLDWSVAVLPAGRVEEEDVKGEDDAHEPRSELDSWNWGLWTKDKGNMVGLPIGIQIVGRRLEEEKVLAAAKVIEDILRGERK